MNTATGQKRSSINGMPDRDADQVEPDTHPGGSAQPGPLPRGGGGYPDSCSTTSPGFRRDPRLAELEEFGLDDHWLATARRIGVDAFLEFWRTLDEQSGGGCVPIPKFSVYVRELRNKAIRKWGEDGLTRREIHRAVRREYCESLSLRHIDRILRGGSIGS